MAKKKDGSGLDPAAAMPQSPPSPSPGGAPPPPGFGVASERTRFDALTPPKKRRHVGWIISGLVLVSLAGTGALVVALSLVSEVTMLAASRSIAAGEILEAGDIEEVRLPARLSATGIPASDRDLYIGQETTGPLGEGALLHPDQFTEPNQVTVDELIVGVALGPDEYPQTGLRPGTVVRLYELSGDTVGFEESTGGVATDLGLGEIVRVQRLQTPDNFLFSIRVDAAVAAQVVDRAKQSRIAVGHIESLSDPVDLDDEDAIEALLDGEDIAESGESGEASVESDLGADGEESDGEASTSEEPPEEG